MARYAIGDIQGCFNEFKQLLEKINFSTHNDQLWLVGDLVNRGPDSLKVLQYITELPKQPIIVLGNHDLHLLAVASGARKINPHDTFEDILNHRDCDQLCNYLKNKPLLYQSSIDNWTMAHAGIYPFMGYYTSPSLCKRSRDNVAK